MILSPKLNDVIKVYGFTFASLRTTKSKLHKNRDYSALTSLAVDDGVVRTRSSEKRLWFIFTSINPITTRTVRIGGEYILFLS